MGMNKHQEKRMEGLARFKCSHEAGGEYYKHIARKDHTFITRLYTKGFYWGYLAAIKECQLLVDALEWYRVHSILTGNPSLGVEAKEALSKWRGDE